MLQDLMTKAGMGNESVKPKSTATAPSQTAAAQAAFLESQLEVSETASAVANMEALFSAVEESQSRLEGIVAGIEVASEGLTPREAAIVNTQVSAYNSTTIPDFQIKFPGNESFDGSSRVAQTRLGNEVIVDKAKELGKWLKEQLIKMIETVQKWITAVFGSAERLKAYAEKLVAKIDDVEIEDEKRKINIPTTILAKGKAAPSDSTIAGVVGDTLASMALVTAETGLVNAVLDASKDVADKKASEIATEAADAGKVGTALKAYSETDPVAAGDEAGALGGKYVKKGDSRSVAAVSDKQAKDKVEITILKPAVCKGILEDIIKLAEKVIDSRKSYGDKKKLADELKKAGDDLGKTSAESDTTADQKASIRVVTGALNKLSKQSVKGVATDWTAHALNICGAAAKACDASLK